MVRYLLVDDTDGSVLAELASADQAGRVLARLALSQHGDPPISVVRTDHHRGSLTDVASTISMRPLPSLMTRRPVTQRSSERTRPRRSRRKPDAS
jgi:hypothetical protein